MCLPHSPLPPSLPTAGLKEAPSFGSLPGVLSTLTWAVIHITRLTAALQSNQAVSQYATRYIDTKLVIPLISSGAF